VRFPGGGGAVEVGATVEPLAVGYHAARRARISADDRVVVIGGGPIGQAAGLGALRVGCAELVVLEPNETRRKLCAELGLVALDPDVGSGPGDAVLEHLGGRPGVVLDAVGTSETVATALELSGVGSRIVLVGMNSPSLTLSAYAVSTLERTILGSFCYSRDEFAETARWAADNHHVLGQMADGSVALDEAPEAFRRLAQGDLKASKVMVRFDREGST
jgi:threonine dehydrogenase-like Zn-dependent dehydrogenase